MNFNRSKIGFGVILLTCMLFMSCTDEDTSAPGLELTSPANGDIVLLDQGIEVVGRVTDNEQISKVQVTSNVGVEWEMLTFDDPTDFPFNLTINLQETTPPGEYILTLSATDISGNASEISKTFEIQ